MACLQSSDIIGPKLSNDQLLRRNEGAILLDGKFSGKRRQCRSYTKEKDLSQDINLELVCNLMLNHCRSLESLNLFLFAVRCELKTF